MRKVTLICGDNRINTTCEGVSQHVHNRLVVHGISKAGRAWYDALPEGHPPVMVYTATNAERLDYLSSDPLP